jgi:hypothetical protein
MLTIFKTIFKSTGKSASRVNTEQRWEQIQTEVLSNPVLFMQIWSIPGIIHHVIFNWLVTIGPILYFFAGIIFTFAAAIYICLLFLHVPMNDGDASKRHYSTDAQIK